MNESQRFCATSCIMDSLLCTLSSAVPKLRYMYMKLNIVYMKHYLSKARECQLSTIPAAGLSLMIVISSLQQPVLTNCLIWAREDVGIDCQFNIIITLWHIYLQCSDKIRSMWVINSTRILKMKQFLGHIIPWIVPRCGNKF